MRTEVVDAATDDPGASSAPPSASRRRDETETAGGGARLPAAPAPSAVLLELRADVLAAAEGALRGDEVAAVSAMVTATETAALREVLEGDARLGTATAASKGETGAAAAAAAFGARRRLGLEVGALAETEVFGGGVPVSRSRSRSEATEAPSSWPGSASALAALGYSEGGWESAGKSATATATEPENDGDANVSRAPGDGASQPAGQLASRRAARSGDSGRRAGEEPSPARLDEPRPSGADSFRAASAALEDGPTASEREGEAEDEAEDGDWATGGTQIEIVPADDTSEDDEDKDSDADEAAKEEDVGGTQIAPEEEDVDVHDTTRHQNSPVRSRSPAGPPPSFLRLASKPAATLPRRLSADAPVVETPGSLWTAAAASAGFKTPPGGHARADGAGAKVAVAATSPFPLSAPAAKASAEVVPETAAAPSESQKTSSREAATKPVEPSNRPSGPLGPNGCADRAETDAPQTLPGGTPAEVMCSYIPSTFPQTKAPTLTESSTGCEAAPVAAVAAAAAAAAEEEVPLSEVPLSVAMSPGAKPLGATGSALAAAMRARRRRHDLAAAGASLSLGPPTDEAEPLPFSSARADAGAGAGASARAPQPRAPSSAPSSALEETRAPAAPDASQPEPERSPATHTRPVVVEAIPGDAFAPLRPAALEAGGAGGGDASREAQRRDDDAAEPRRRSDVPAASRQSVGSPGIESPEPGEANDRPGWAGGWGRVADARRGDRAAPPRDAGGVARREDPTQESPREEVDAPASPDFCLMLSQRVRDVVADATADAPSQSTAPFPSRRASISAAGVPKPRRQSSIAAQARMQRLWDEKEARDSAARRRSRRARKPRTFFGDSRFPSPPRDGREEDDDTVEASDDDEADVSDPESESESEEETSEDETGTTPLAERRATRLRKPRTFFGDSRFPSSATEDDAAAENDEEALEICESDEDEAPWYVGGTQAFTEPRGDAADEKSEDEDKDASLPPTHDEDEGNGDEDEADETDRGNDEAALRWASPPRARRVAARVAVVRKPAARGTPASKTKTPATKIRTRGAERTGNPEWRGPLPRLGCPKCRHAAKGCGRCRAIRAHAEFGTPLPWRAKTVGGAPASAPPATRVGRRVRFDDESANPDGPASGSAGAKRRRVSAAAVRASLSSMAEPTVASRRASASSARNALSASAKGSASGRGARPLALALASGGTSDDGAGSSASRRRFRRVSRLFQGWSFLLSGIPSKEQVDELTELLETHGGVVRRDVPPPAPPRVASADLYAPSQDVGAPARSDAPGARTRVLTPSFGRTLKCLYAVAVGAPVLTPDWVRDCVDAGEALALDPYLVGADVGSDAAEDGESRRARAGGPRVFDGAVVSLSGDANYVRQFGVLLRHAGADIVDAADLIAAEGSDVPVGEGPCDYVLVQTVAGAGARRKGRSLRVEGGLARASKRLGVPCVRHEWAVDSLLANRLKDVDETYRLG